LFEKLQLQVLHTASSARDELGLTADEVSIAGCLPPLMGSYTVDERPFSELKSEYEQIVAIQAPVVDLFLIETISNVKEAKAAVEAALPGGKPVWLSLTLSDLNPNQRRLPRSAYLSFKSMVRSMPRCGTKFRSGFGAT